MVLLNLFDDQSKIIINTKGAYLQSYVIRNKNVILNGTEIQTRGGMALLIPFANRIKDGKYVWNGKTYKLKINQEGNAIHGFAKDKEFQVIERNDNSILLNTSIKDTGYPSNLLINVQYELKKKLYLEIEIINEGKEKAPLLVGTHPYFIIDGEWEISPNKAKKCISRNKIPTGEFEDSIISYGEYDDCFYFPDNVIINSKYSKINLIKQNMDFIQIYTGIKGSLAVEPMSGAPNSFNNKIGLKSLDPGNNEIFKICIDVEKI
ncbi:MAG: aldose 1-epimerase [Thermoplasmata archaeon]